MYSYIDETRSGDVVYTENRWEAYAAFVLMCPVWKEGKRMSWFGPND